MTTIDDRHRENSQQNDGDPMSLAQITAALLRAGLKPREGQASQTHRTVGFGGDLPPREEARCPT